MCPFYNAYLFEITGTTKGVFTHSQSSCHIAKVVLAFSHDSRQIPLTRHLATPPAVSFIGGFRTTAPVQAASSRMAVIRNPSHIRTLAPQQDTHSADHFIGAREHHWECRTLLFDSNCAALHSANFVNDITYPTGDRM